MKKIILTIVILVVLMSGISLSAYNLGQLMHDFIDDPKNPGERYLMSFYCKSFGVVDQIIIAKYVMEGISSFYVIMWIYDNSDGKFVSSEIKIQVDAMLYEIADPDPYGLLRPSGKARETIGVRIDENILRSMANSSELRIQAFGESVDIPESGIQILKRFYGD